MSKVTPALIFEKAGIWKTYSDTSEGKLSYSTEMHSEAHE